MPAASGSVGAPPHGTATREILQASAVPRRARALSASLAARLLIYACAAPVVPGRWQVVDNPEAGFEIRADGTFQSEIGPAGGPRLRLIVTWTANGDQVTLMPNPTKETTTNTPLVGKISGDDMTLGATVQGLGALTLNQKRRSRE
ncbi:MAG: hypothetical protein FJ033_16740 [Chloroflexi bacterium]|nr:hypothetical protein [Chloroflexota bacterium]